MKVLIVNNILREGPGILKDILKENSINYCVHEFGKGDAIPSPKEYGAIFVFGGPESANDKSEKMLEELTWVKNFILNKVPYFGVCLGMQVMVKALGGVVKKAPVKEVGWRDPNNEIFKINLTKAGRNDPLFQGLESELLIFQLHGETVEIPKGMKLLGEGKYCKNQIVKYGTNSYGFQGHIELSKEMFYTWIQEDDDLNKLDINLLDLDYKKIRSYYENVGTVIFNNFLKISNFQVK